MRARSHVPSPRRAAPRWRLTWVATSCLVGFLLLGQLLGAAHFVLVPHRMCPMHGLEDAASAAAPVAHALGNRRASVTQQHAELEGAHSPCLLVSLSRDQLIAKPQHAELARPEGLAVVRAHEVPPHNCAPWLLAPKQGPPA